VLPERLAVKLSSEAAEYVALTPVVNSEISLVELLEHVADIAGLDEARVADVLKRGSLVSGATRFRWACIHAELEEIRAAIAALPQPEPGRPLDAAQCSEVALVGRMERIRVTVKAGAERRIFKRRSFWDEMMTLAGQAVYAGYLYRERADRYSMPAASAAWLDQATQLLRYDGLRQRIVNIRVERIEFIVPRRAGS